APAHPPFLPTPSAPPHPSPLPLPAPLPTPAAPPPPPPRRPPSPPAPPRLSHAGCGGRVERTLTNTSCQPAHSAWSMVSSPSQLTSRSRIRLVRSASRGPTTTRRDGASSRTT